MAGGRWSLAKSKANHGFARMNTDIEKSTPTADERLALEQSRDIVAAHFVAYGFFQGGGRGLMRSLFQHGGEPEEIALRRLVEFARRLPAHKGEPVSVASGTEEIDQLRDSLNSASAELLRGVAQAGG